MPSAWRNTTYQRDLSISYERLADLARQAGQGDRARELHQRSLEIAQALADAEPGNTTYQRDLSISYERLADLAAEAGQAEDAQQCLMIALDMRQRLHQREPDRVDLAEELGVTLYLFTSITDDQVGIRQQITDLLVPFEQIGALTRKGVSLLGWAGQPPAH